MINWAFVTLVAGLTLAISGFGSLYVLNRSKRLASSHNYHKMIAGAIATLVLGITTGLAVGAGIYIDIAGYIVVCGFMWSFIGTCAAGAIIHNQRRMPEPWQKPYIKVSLFMVVIGITLLTIATGLKHEHFFDHVMPITGAIMAVVAVMFWITTDIGSGHIGGGSDVRREFVAMLIACMGGITFFTGLILHWIFY